MPTVEASAPARAALAGNPSDGYGGRVLAVTLPQLAARARARAADDLTVSPHSELVAATVRRFARLHAPGATASAIAWATTNPRGVGLAGSSAIVIATTRALAALHGIVLVERTLAEFALAVEVEELGIAAGLQDRVAQAYGGLTFMDFAGAGHYERLDPRLLPPILVAWRAETAEESHDVHGRLRERFAHGDATVRAGMNELAELAAGARNALLAGDRDALRRCVDGSYDVRARVMNLDPRHVEMIEIARGCGAAANYTGSGGAIVAVCRSDGHRAELRRALERVACATLTPSAR
jgi:glucuronokinase